MPSIGIACFFAGFSVFYYGLDQIKGGNNSFLSMVKPGGYSPVAADVGSAAAKESKNEKGIAKKAPAISTQLKDQAASVGLFQS